MSVLCVVTDINELSVKGKGAALQLCGIDRVCELEVLDGLGNLLLLSGVNLDNSIAERRGGPCDGLGLAFNQLNRLLQVVVGKVLENLSDLC